MNIWQAIAAFIFTIFCLLLGYAVATRKQRSQSHDVAELELDAARSIIDHQRKEISKLETLNLDMDAQIKELLARDAITKEQAQYFAQLKRDFDAMKLEQDKLAKYLRVNKAREITAGKHMGMSLADVCIMYMGQTERTLQ